MIPISTLDQFCVNKSADNNLSRLLKRIDLSKRGPLYWSNNTDEVRQEINNLKANLVYSLTQMKIGLEESLLISQVVSRFLYFYCYLPKELEEIENSQEKKRYVNYELGQRVLIELVSFLDQIYKEKQKEEENKQDNYKSHLLSCLNSIRIENKQPSIYELIIGICCNKTIYNQFINKYRYQRKHEHCNTNYVIENISNNLPNNLLIKGKGELFSWSSRLSDKFRISEHKFIYMENQELIERVQDYLGFKERYLQTQQIQEFIDSNLKELETNSGRYRYIITSTGVKRLSKDVSCPSNCIDLGKIKGTQAKRIYDLLITFKQDWFNYI